MVHRLVGHRDAMAGSPDLGTPSLCGATTEESQIPALSTLSRRFGRDDGAGR
jgi:hypothetical protein